MKANARQRGYSADGRDLGLYRKKFVWAKDHQGVSTCVRMLQVQPGDDFALVEFADGSVVLWPSGQLYAGAVVIVGAVDGALRLPNQTRFYDSVAELRKSRIAMEVERAGILPATVPGAAVPDIVNGADL